MSLHILNIIHVQYLYLLFIWVTECHRRLLIDCTEVQADLSFAWRIFNLILFSSDFFFLFFIFTTTCSLKPIDMHSRLIVSLQAQMYVFP